MNTTPITLARGGIYVVYVATAVLVGGSALGMWASVPEKIAGYVTQGLMLPASRYGLLFPLAACGIILADVRRPIALAAHFTVLASAFWTGLKWAGPLYVFEEPWVSLLVRHPGLATGMGLVTGCTLLLPLRTRRWFVLIACTCCGLGLGLAMFLESPGDYHSGWFASAGGLGGMAIVIVSVALADVAMRIGSGDWFIVVGRILGSWLVAASLMLTALAFVPKKPIAPAPTPDGIPGVIDLDRQP